MIAVAIAAAISSAPVSDVAAWQTGNDLLRFCTTPRSSDACFGYIERVADAMADGVPLFGRRACIPAGADAGQIRDVAVRYLESRPDIRHGSAAQLAAIAYSEAFPCPR